MHTFCLNQLCLLKWIFACVLRNHANKSVFILSNYLEPTPRVKQKKDVEVFCFPDEIGAANVSSDKNMSDSEFLHDVTNSSDDTEEERPDSDWEKEFIFLEKDIGLTVSI